jgi:hypothetical protein
MQVNNPADDEQPWLVYGLYRPCRDQGSADECYCLSGRNVLERTCGYNQRVLMVLML